MDMREGKRGLTTVLLTMILSMLPLTQLFSVIPLQMYYKKARNRRSYWIVSIICLLALTVIARYAPIPEESALAEWSNLLFPSQVAFYLFLIGGLMFVNTGDRFIRRRYFRLLTVSGVWGLLTVASLVNPAVKAEVVLGMEKFIFMISSSEIFKELPASATVGINPEILFPIIVLSAFVSIFIEIGIGVWLGDRFYQLSEYRKPKTLAEFYLPEKMIWFLLTPWSLLLLAMLIPLPENAYVEGILLYLNGWGWIALVSYGIQGLGMIHSLLDRYKVGNLARAIVTVVLILIFFNSELNRILLLLPLAGAMETWIKIRDPKRS